MDWTRPKNMTVTKTWKETAWAAIKLAKNAVQYRSQKSRLITVLLLLIYCVYWMEATSCELQKAFTTRYIRTRWWGRPDKKTTFRAFLLLAGVLLTWIAQTHETIRPTAFQTAELKVYIIWGIDRMPRACMVVDWQAKNGSLTSGSG
jgi:hypothetical protein